VKHHDKINRAYDANFVMSIKWLPSRETLEQNSATNQNRSHLFSLFVKITFFIRWSYFCSKKNLLQWTFVPKYNYACGDLFQNIIVPRDINCSKTLLGQMVYGTNVYWYYYFLEQMSIGTNVLWNIRPGLYTADSAAFRTPRIPRRFPSNSKCIDLYRSSYTRRM